MPGFNYRMTELQAAVGIAQLKKLNYIISENKKRFNILQSSLINKLYLRRIYPGSKPSYDTFIFQVNNKKTQKKIIQYLNKIGLGTKNLPDAIKWHFAYFWKHAIDKSQIKNTINSKKILEKYIAIPILLRKNIKTYKKISNDLLKII